MCDQLLRGCSSRGCRHGPDGCIMTSDAITPGSMGPKSRNEVIHWAQRESTKSGVAHTKFISLAGHNLAVSWKTGSEPNASSRLSSAAQSGLTLSPASLHNWSIETIVEEQKHDDYFSDRRQHTSGPVFGKAGAM